MARPAARLLASSLALALALASACGDDDPFPGCPGEERVPAFCGSEPEERCQCNTCHLGEDGEVRCNLALSLAQATCRADGSDWETCGCRSGAPREECVAACQTLRCSAECDGQSVVSCEQRCQDFFDDHEKARGAPPSEACATAIATIALCSPTDGCPQASPCEDAADWDTQRDLYLSECGSD